MEAATGRRIGQRGAKRPARGLPLPAALFLSLCIHRLTHLGAALALSGAMNKDTAEGNWTELKGKIKAKWAKLTDNDIDELKGNMESLSGKIQKQYGYAKEQAEKEYKHFKESLAKK